jgi:hypothetical protein
LRINDEIKPFREIGTAPEGYGQTRLRLVSLQPRPYDRLLRSELRQAGLDSTGRLLGGQRVSGGRWRNRGEIRKIPQR